MGAGITLAREAKLRTVLDAGGHLHVAGDLHAPRPVSTAGLTRIGDDRALALAGRTGGNVHVLAEQRLLDAANLAAAIARGALGAVAARGLALAAAIRAALRPLEIDLLLGTEDRFFEIDRQPRLQIGTALGAGASGGGAAEEGVEDVAEAAHRIEAGEALAAGFGVAKAVVAGSLLRIGEHLVGRVHLFEASLGAVVFVAVRVVFHGKLAEGTLDVLGRGATIHVKN